MAGGVVSVARGREEARRLDGWYQQDELQPKIDEHNLERRRELGLEDQRPDEQAGLEMQPLVGPGSLGLAIRF